ncbi:S8 family serine peptidase [Tissierella sp. MSJ-40]|uniref:S8 family serine peptidase n=1 Tax=Tissierella simiarum TaxID=2841534 RepID=A0ABS6E4B6_9FIRM|nr:S8 family serine peptidase [Tissierella simiarum]MBU5437607.1 S8 family serine peptidase [Tissierella simiarum]
MKRCLVLLLVLSLCLSLTGFTAYAEWEKQDYEKQEYMVQFDIKEQESLSKDVFTNMQLDTLKSINVEKNDILETYDLFPVYCLKLTEKQVEELKNNPNIKTIEPNIMFEAYAQTIPWGISKVQATNAHQNGHTGNGIKVAVLDSGIDANHEDLNVRGGYSVFNDSPYYDGNGHGTHVAGTIAALNNSVGVVGVAYDAELYAVKVLNSQGSGSLSGIAKGLEWAIQNNMNIINMSLGSSQPSDILKQWCDLAYNSGILVVAAAGNSGNSSGTGDTVGYPAKYASVMAVASTDSNDRRASTSSTGPTVEISAPGVSIYSTIPNNRYGNMSGTSMASPHVAGAAALVWKANPSLNNQQLRQRLVSTAKYLGNSNHYGAGLVQVSAAIGQEANNPIGDEWKLNTNYKPGDIIIYEGNQYECLQEHTSIIGWEPINAPSLWKII